VRKALSLLALVLASSALAVADDGVEFQYTVKRGDSAASATGAVQGFDTADGLGLKVRFEQAGYCYLLLREGGRYRVAFPTRPEGAPGEGSAWVPRSTLVRLGESPDVDRMVLVVAQEPVAELEEALRTGRLLDESVATGVRDRTLAGGAYSRAADGDRVSVKYRPKAGDTAVVVEEIPVRPR
jgi:hypothetical protein